jgi:putative ABC transport system permease protein
LPFFHTLIGKVIPFAFWHDKQFLFYMAIVVLAGTLASAFYPAFVLSSFKPVWVLKGIQ